MSDTKTAPSAPAAAESFWRFSLALYSRPKVAEACIELQDGAGVDVNVLLFLLWAAGRGRKLSAQEVRRYITAVGDWRTSVVVPLRTARRSLRAPPSAIERAGAAKLRALVKKVELEAERLQQCALASLAPVGRLGKKAPPEAAAAANVETYAAALGAAFPAAPVRTILEAFGCGGERS